MQCSQMELQPYATVKVERECLLLPLQAALPASHSGIHADCKLPDDGRNSCAELHPQHTTTVICSSMVESREIQAVCSA